MRRSDIPVEKVTLNLYKGDFEKLRNFFPRPGASHMIRNILRQFIRKVESDVETRVGSEPISFSFNKELEE